MLRRWTIGRATGVGAVAGLAALALWPAYAAFPQPVLLPYLAALAVAHLCGLSILWITALDLLFHARRDRRLLPLRVFDVAFALALSLPSGSALLTLLPGALLGNGAFTLP